jgi:kinesin family protein 11
MKGLLVDADQLLVELQNGLSQQEMNFSTFIEQQHEVHHLSQHLPFSYLYSTVYLSSFKKKINSYRNSPKTWREQSLFLQLQ